MPTFLQVMLIFEAVFFALFEDRTIVIAMTHRRQKYDFPVMCWSTALFLVLVLNCS